MADINADVLPWNFVYLGFGGGIISASATTMIVVDSIPFPPDPEPINGSNGNRLLATSYIVDMGYPVRPGSSAQTGPTRDRKGRPVSFD